MGLVACQSCGYAYYRTSTRTKKRKLYYYRCLGSDDYRYEHGRICDNKPVRADYLDDLVWGQVTALLADPRLVQAELDRRLEELRAANPATAERARLELDLARATKGIERLVQAYQEDLLTLDELRARMPELRSEGDEPERSARVARRAASRPRDLPHADREPGGLPLEVARHVRGGDRRRSTEGGAQRGQGGPGRTRACRHPTLDPCSPPLSARGLSIAFEESSHRCSPTSSCTTRSTDGWSGNTRTAPSSATRMMQ